MLYTEWLRVRGTLKWISIVLGVVILFCGIARVVLIPFDTMTYVRTLQNEPDSKVSVTTPAEGITQTVIVNDREQVRATILDRGYEGLHVDIIDKKPHQNTPKHIFGGTVSIQMTNGGNGQETVVDTNQPVFFGAFTILGLVIALLAATILGAPFAKENDGHLEIALTKPIERTALSVQTMLVDCTGVIAAFAIGVIFSFIFHAIFDSFKVRMTWNDISTILNALLGAIAWYAMLNAFTASMKRAYGVVLGLAWPVWLLVVGLAGLPPGNDVRDLIRTVCGLVNYIDPLKYLNIATATTNQIVLLAVLALVYGTLAAIQWRRVEA